MSIKKVHEQLALYCGQQRQRRKSAQGLQAFLRSKSFHPDPPAQTLAERNKAMCHQRMDGFSWEEIASGFPLSKERG